MVDFFQQLLPFFLLVGAGYLAVKFKLVGSKVVGLLTKAILWIFLPSVLLVKLATTPFETLLNPAFLSAYLLAAFSLMLVGGAVGFVLFEKRRSNAVMIGLSGAYGNIGFLAIPLLGAVVGDWTSVPLALILTLDLMVLLPVASFLLQLGDQKTHKGDFTALQSLKRALVNPLILSIVLGLALSGLELKIPSVTQDGFTLLGKAAGPCAMFVVGTSLFGKKMSGKIGETLYMSGLKLVAYPVVVWLAMTLFDIPVDWKILAVLAAAMPCAAVLSVIAEEYRTMAAQAASAVLVTTVASAVLLPALIGYLGP